MSISSLAVRSAQVALPDPITRPATRRVADSASPAASAPPVQESPPAPAPPPALFSEQMTMLRYAGMGEALRQLVGGESI